MIVHGYDVVEELPAGSVVVSAKVCDPTARPLSVTGLAAVVGGPPSRLYRVTRIPDPAGVSLVVKANAATPLVVCAGGVLVKVALGAASSTTRARLPEAGLVADPLLSVAVIA